MSAKDDDRGPDRISTTSPTNRPSSINELDDIEAALKWMAKGRADTRGFAKHLPHTSQDLRDGKVNPEQVAGDLEEIYTPTKTVQMMSDTEMDSIIEMDSTGGPQLSTVVTISHLTTMIALPAKLFQTEDEQTKIGLAFSDDLQENLIARVGGDCFTPESCSLPVKESLDEVCELWADRLDKSLFRGKTGAFLKKCSLYGVTPETFHKKGMPFRLFIDNYDERWCSEKRRVTKVKKDTILAAARNVALGLQDVKHMCWECKSFSKDAQCCSKCKTAKYCSKECQVASWKQGHNENCKGLRSRYDAFEKSMKTVDGAHKNTTDSAAVTALIECKIALSDEIDYRVLELMTSLPPYKGTRLEPILGEPQMEFFYKNIGRVARGEFWFYKDVDDTAYNEVNLMETEMPYFLGLCVFLCYDYAMASPSIEFDESSYVMRFRSTNEGMAMSASRFILVYNSCRSTANSTDRFRLRREIRNRSILKFIDKFHK